MRLAAAALAVLALTGNAARASDGVGPALWSVFERVCSAAFADGQTFVNDLPSWAPPDSHGTMSSEDGQMFKAEVFAQRYHHSYSVAVMGMTMVESCSSTFGGSAVSDPAATAAAIKAAILASQPASVIVGGRFPELWREIGYGERETDYHGPVQQNPDDFHFHIGDFAGDTRITIFVQVVGGYASVAATRMTRNGG